MKLSSLLILIRNTKKIKELFKSTEKTKQVLFPGRILTCGQKLSAVYNTFSPVKKSFDLEQIATEIIVGVLASQIHPD